MECICIIGGASTGTNKVYYEASVLLGKYLAEKKYQVMYAGSRMGLMGAIADSAKEGGSRLIGAMPEFLLKKEVVNHRTDKFFVTKTMTERKKYMCNWGDSYVVAPGGLGTLAIVFDIITWKQAGLHSKPVAFYNINGYFDGLLESLKKMSELGFIKPEDIDDFVVETDLNLMFSKLQAKYDALDKKVSGMNKA